MLDPGRAYMVWTILVSLKKRCTSYCTFRLEEGEIIFTHKIQEIFLLGKRETLLISRTIHRGDTSS